MPQVCTKWGLQTGLGVVVGAGSDTLQQLHTFTLSKVHCLAYYEQSTNCISLIELAVVL